MDVIENRAESKSITAYEPTDVDARHIWFTGAGLVVVTLLSALIVFLIVVFGLRDQNRQASTTTERTVPPEPRLQRAPTRDFAEYRAQQQSILQSYGWVNRAKGLVRIPIAEAIKIIADRGIPPQTAPPDLKLSTPEEGDRLTGFERNMTEDKR